MANFLKLHRKVLDWCWYSDINTKVLFLHCLLKANWKAGEWQGIQYNAGEFITSLETLSKETSLTVSQVRTGLQHLILTGEIASKSQGKCRIITVNNWCSYQEDNKEDSKEVARSSQGHRKVVATDIEVKNSRSKEVKNISSNNIFIKPTLDEVRAYCNERQNGINPEQFVDYYESKGWLVGKTKMKDWKAAVRTWENNRKGDNVNEQPKGRVERNTQSREEYEAEMRELAKGLYGNDEE